MAEEIIITEENFETEVLNSDKPVLVDFWATWCGPCQMQGPIFEALAKENDGTTKFAKVNVDELHDIAVKYKVRSIPTIMLFKDGEVVKKAVGLQQKRDLLDLIN